jgi:hypothetical protein
MPPQRLFFDWVVRTKDKTFVTRLNAACRSGEYKPELFEEYAGKSVDDLWNKSIESVKKPAPKKPVPRRLPGQRAIP